MTALTEIEANLFLAGIMNALYLGRAPKNVLL